MTVEPSDVMVDIETLSSKRDAVILSIGAVRFNWMEFTGQDIPDDEKLYVRVDAQSCVDAGLGVEVGTVLWWMRQGAEARAEFKKPGLPLERALGDLADFYRAGRGKVWGNGSDFDNVILANAYDKTGLPLPWKYWDHRCHRTMVGEAGKGIPKPRKGTYHNALDDAVNQAVHLSMILRRMRGRKLEGE